MKLLETENPNKPFDNASLDFDIFDAWIGHFCSVSVEFRSNIFIFSADN